MSSFDHFPRPVLRVEGRNFYSDTKGSVVDPEKLHEHLELILPLRAFATDASKRADSSDPEEQKWGFAMMHAWAKGRALLDAPLDFIGKRERQRFTIALNIIALKLRACGLNIEPLLAWLNQLNRGVIADFAQHVAIGNLYVWSGVCAASCALLDADSDAKRYENHVWQRSVDGIRADGFIEPEIRRGARALLYHVYYLSALLTLAAFRRALGESPSRKDYIFINCLVAGLGRALYDPSPLVALSGSREQDVIPPIQLAPIMAWGTDFLNPGFLSYVSGEIPADDPILGGDLSKTAEILAHLRRGSAAQTGMMQPAA